MAISLEQHLAQSASYCVRVFLGVRLLVMGSLADQFLGPPWARFSGQRYTVIDNIARLPERLRQLFIALIK